MKSFLALLSILLLTFSQSFSQDAELTSLVEGIKANVKEVKSGDDTYVQSITSPSTGVLVYSLQEIDKKGRTTNYTYEFNLADLDPYAVRQETDGDVLLASMTVANKQSLIKTTEDGEAGKYEDELQIMAADIENARLLIDHIKKAIPLAEDYVENKLDLAGYENMYNWLATNIKDVRVDETTYKQSLSKGDYPGSVVYTRIEVDGGDSEVLQYVFNLGDINENSLEFDISGEELGLNFETIAEQDIIRKFENQQPDGFTDEVLMMANNVEEARDIRTVLGLAIPEARKATEQAMPTINSQEQALSKMAEYLDEVNYGDMQMQQTVDPQCVTTFRIAEQDDEETEVMEYKLNIMDLNSNDLKYDVSGGKMHFELVVSEKEKLVKEYENSEFNGYTDDFKVYCEDVEVARRFRHALTKAIEFCKKNYRAPYPEGVSATVQWMIDNIPEVKVGDTKWEQSLERVDEGNHDKIKYTRTEIDDSGGEQEIFEFLFSDINPLSLKYEISGDELAISFATNFEAEIIKHYKDGEIQKYEKEVDMVFADVEMARNFLSAINEVIDELAEK